MIGNLLVVLVVVAMCFLGGWLKAKDQATLEELVEEELLKEAEKTEEKETKKATKKKTAKK